MCLRLCVLVVCSPNGQAGVPSPPRMGKRRPCGVTGRAAKENFDRGLNLDSVSRALHPRAHNDGTAWDGMIGCGRAGWCWLLACRCCVSKAPLRINVMQGDLKEWMTPQATLLGPKKYKQKKRRYWHTRGSEVVTVVEAKIASRFEHTFNARPQVHGDDVPFWGSFDMFTSCSPRGPRWCDRSRSGHRRWSLRRYAAG